MSQSNYLLGSTESEQARLGQQGNRLSGPTLQLFQRAGIGPGMRVLDIGSGGGDVAFLAASLVGPAGEVIGAELELPHVKYASRRAADEGYANVKFIAADFHELVLDRSVDAIVGRLVLVHTPDPATALRRVCRNLRSGGVAAFYENIIFNDSLPVVWPVSSLAARAVSWYQAGRRQAGTHDALGLRLPEIMRNAGLIKPEFEGAMQLSAGPNGTLFKEITSIVRSALPSIVASGVATLAEIDIDTLEQRMVADAPPLGVVGSVTQGWVAAWATMP
jgi:SAM-dependent methyltransferase